MKKVMIIFGTRPEAIKMAPVIHELQSRKGFEVVICTTGQHKEMLQSVLEVFEIEPHYDLQIMKANQSLFDITINILMKLKEVLDIERPDLVLVHGDTTTTFVSALSCFYLNIPVGHVEAGLRTYDLHNPFPEEFNRKGVSIIADYNFAPTTWAKNNLLKEGVDESRIFVTGNTVIDALKTTVRSDFEHPLLEWVGNYKLVLVTAHRRENVGEPMIEMFRAIKRIIDQHEDIKVIYPIHMNPKIREIASEVFDCCDRIRIVPPMDVIDFHNILARSYIVLTDSGGIQEESSGLKVPVLVMRKKTERPEGVEANSVKLVGNDEESVIRGFCEIYLNKDSYDAMKKAKNPFGDGTAAKQIADILERLM